MPNPENILGQGFHTHPERINKKGRPLKITNIIRKSGYTKDDMRAAFEEVGWLTEAELETLLEDPKTPVIIKLNCKAFQNGYKKGDFRYVSEIVSHAYGKPTEQTENKHLHKIIVEYVNPNDRVIPSTPEPAEDS